MSTYCKCYYCGAEDGIDVDDGVCSECGYPDKVIAELKAERDSFKAEAGRLRVENATMCNDCNAVLIDEVDRLDTDISRLLFRAMSVESALDRLTAPRTISGPEADVLAECGRDILAAARLVLREREEADRLRGERDEARRSACAHCPHYRETKSCSGCGWESWRTKDKLRAALAEKESSCTTST